MSNRLSSPAVNSSASWLSVREIIMGTALAIMVVVSTTSLVDDYAEVDLDSLFQRALISFALARTLNGVISAVQGTEVALQPAGVGVTLTPGEILDPINDLVERFSWIMLGATISLGIQQVLLDVGQWWGLRALLTGLALGLLLVRIRRSKTSNRERGSLEQGLFYVLIATLFIRFAVPMALIANEVVYDLFLESRYLESTQELQEAGQALESVGTGNSENAGANGAEERAETRSFFGQVIDGAKKTLDLERKVSDVRQKTAELIEHLIQLSVVFILQTGILPLVFLWLLVSSFRFTLRFRPKGPSEHVENL